MSGIATLAARRRNEVGTKSARLLRNMGLVPAVVYGHKQAVVHVTVNDSDVHALLRHGAHGLIELDMEGSKETAIIKDLQFDVFGREVLHIDFARVSAGESVTVEVPIVLKGTAPGVAEGGVLDQPMHTIEIVCPVSNLQESLVVNLKDLHKNQAIHVKDLTLPEGVKATADGEQIVVQCREAKADVEATEAPTTGAEPELIRREKAEGETEE